MFKSAEIGRNISKTDFDKLEPQLRIKLFNAQRKIIENNIPTIIIISGIDTSGRGETYNMLSEWLDAKHIRTHSYWYETDEEKARPYMWRFWRTLPASGETGIYVGAWYANAIRSLKAKDKKAETKFIEFINRCADFERELALSGTLIVKIWLHISKDVFKERIGNKIKNTETVKFTKYDKNKPKDYDQLIYAASKAIKITDKQVAPWYIIDAKDSDYRKVAVAEVISQAMENAVKNKISTPVKETENEMPHPKKTLLDSIDLSVSISHDDYKKELVNLSKEINALTYKAYKKGISSVILFEGWDAAGKGGAIRRLSTGIDARINRVIPISSPTDEEKAHHYLWRFWRHIPMNGAVTIYDRSWYGRVLVERVDNLASASDWKRAYEEINDFEEQLAENGTILVKFWLHISAEEQLKRFKERENTPWKQHKITPDDWHNR